MSKIKIFWMAAFAVAMLASCKKDDDRSDLVIPDTYDGSAFLANAATELSVREQLRVITAEAQRGRVNGVTLEYSTLTALLNAGNPSLSQIGTRYFITKLDGPGGWLDEMAKASGGTYTPGPPSGNGGTFGGYLFDENGFEIEQVMEKGMFGAVLFHHAVNLLSAEIDAATSDKVLAIFGSNPSFPNSSNASKHPAPDVQFAVYAARRTDETNSNGLYFQLKRAFIKLQAATKAGSAYKAEQQEAAAEIKAVWEKVNAATIINYTLSAISTLSNSELTEQQKASALHSLGEAVGFMHGYKNVPGKKISDAQIDEVLTLLNTPASGTSEMYKFATDPVTQLPKLQQINSLLQSLYGFSNAEMESFRNNWVNIQNR